VHPEAAYVAVVVIGSQAAQEGLADKAYNSGHAYAEAHDEFGLGRQLNTVCRAGRGTRHERYDMEHLTLASTCAPTWCSVTGSNGAQLRVLADLRDRQWVRDCFGGLDQNVRGRDNLET
jgi:hypothetical protein